MLQLDGVRRNEVIACRFGYNLKRLLSSGMDYSRTGLKTKSILAQKD